MSHSLISPARYTLHVTRYMLHVTCYTLHVQTGECLRSGPCHWLGKQHQKKGNEGQTENIRIIEISGKIFCVPSEVMTLAYAGWQTNTGTGALYCRMGHLPPSTLPGTLRGGEYFKIKQFEFWDNEQIRQYSSRWPHIRYKLLSFTLELPTFISDLCSQIAIIRVNIKIVCSQWHWHATRESFIIYPIGGIL